MRSPQGLAQSLVQGADPVGRLDGRDRDRLRVGDTVPTGNESASIGRPQSAHRQPNGVVIKPNTHADNAWTKIVEAIVAKQ